MKIFKNRNSYSKTDHDATFMRMKDGYISNGQLKAGYNLQGSVCINLRFISKSDRYAHFHSILNIEDNYFALSQSTVADAGYGSKQNYDDVLMVRKRIPLITYNQYRKEKEKKFKNDPFKTANWEYDDVNDSFVCPNNRRLYFAYRI